MKRIIIYICLLFISNHLSGQLHRTTNIKFEEKIDDLLSETMPFIYISDLEGKDLDSIILLDAREWEEYEVSHIPNARYIGYDQPVFSVLSDVELDSEVIVYCSIGYRSEKMAEQLKKQGFKNVFNLYGSIFEWVNQGNEIEDIHGDPTQNIHTYNKTWSKWMINERFQKTW